MQLAAPSSPDPSARDLATAIRDAQRVIGQGPAITVLFPEGRQEQGMASLAQWVAKGAHLIETDLLLEPGDRLALDSPLSWTGAAVCLAAWWAGVTIDLGPTDPSRAYDVAVMHEDRLGPEPSATEVLVLGDAIDGSPHRDTGHEPWVRAVQSFPDHPPMPHATPGSVALAAGDRRWTQAELLEAARPDGPPPAGTAGIDASAAPAWLGLLAAAVRPLVTGRPTVILRGVGRDAAAGDRVVDWFDTAAYR